MFRCSPDTSNHKSPVRTYTPRQTRSSPTISTSMNGTTVSPEAWVHSLSPHGLSLPPPGHCSVPLLSTASLIALVQAVLSLSWAVPQSPDWPLAFRLTPTTQPTRPCRVHLRHPQVALSPPSPSHPQTFPLHLWLGTQGPPWSTCLSSEQVPFVNPQNPLGRVSCSRLYAALRTWHMQSVSHSLVIISLMLVLPCESMSLWKVYHKPWH